MSEQTRYKSRILMALMLVLALWASTVLAGANEDFLKAAERGDLNAVRSFIARGADVNAKDQDGWTALISTSHYGHKELVEFLLAKGADVNIKANNGATALSLASREGYKEIVELLLAKGADINIKANDGATALMGASENGHKEIVELLIRAGADATTQEHNFKYEARFSNKNPKVALVVVIGTPPDVTLDNPSALFAFWKAGGELWTLRKDTSEIRDITGFTNGRNGLILLEMVKKVNGSRVIEGIVIKADGQIELLGQ